MTNRLCKVGGCACRTTRHGLYCKTHDTTSRRHGHPEQKAIRHFDLKPYIERVLKRIEKNPDSPVWSIGESRWLDVVAHAQEVLCSKKATIRWERLAASEVIKIADCVEPRTIVETALAFYLLAEDQPRRLKSDRAHDFQLARRVRGLAPLNVGQWYNHGTGRMQMAYKDIAPRTTMYLANWIKQALGSTGLMLADKERREAKSKLQRTSILYDALSALQ